MTSVIPPGFSKCSGCGQMVGANGACPACSPPPPTNVNVDLRVNWLPSVQNTGTERDK